MEQLSNIRVIRDLMERHGFTFSKALGQNFLINPSVCPQMAIQGGVGPDTGVLEIGPGKTLTGFMRKINRDVKVNNIDKLEDFKNYVGK